MTQRNQDRAYGTSVAFCENMAKYTQSILFLRNKLPECRMQKRVLPSTDDESRVLLVGLLSRKRGSIRVSLGELVEDRPAYYA